MPNVKAGTHVVRNIEVLSSTIKFLSGSPGSGKTHVQISEICRLVNEGESVLYVQPSMKLQEETEKSLRALGVRCTVINSQTVSKLQLSSELGESKVGGAIQAALRAPQSFARCLMITVSSLERLPFFPNKHLWHLFMDEIPQVYSCDEDGGKTLARLWHVDVLNPKGCHPVRARCKREMLSVAKKLAASVLAGKKTLKDATALAYRLASEQYDTFTPKLKGDEGEHAAGLPTVSLLKPSIVEGYRSILIAGAEVKASPLYRHWSNQGVVFEEALDLKARLRFEQPPNGSATTFHYVFDKEFSKTFRDREDLDVVKWMQEAAIKVFGGSGFLYSCNKDTSGLFEGVDKSVAVYLPNDSKGSNEYDKYHNSVLICARNLKPVHRKLLMRLLDVDSEFLKTSQHRHEILQQYQRTSARNPDCFIEKHCVVPDYTTAVYLSQRVPGSHISRVDLGIDESRIVRPLGRPKKHDDQRAKNIAYRKRNIEMMKTEFLISIDAKVRESGVLDGCDENTLYITFSSNPTVRQFFCCEVLCVESYDLEPHVFKSFESFKAWMRKEMAQEYASKEDVPLISPACFVKVNGVSTTKGRDNALFANLLFLDIENGDMSHEQFAKIFKDLSFFAHSSYSCTETSLRYRICIPTTLALFPSQYAALIGEIVRRVEAAGFSASRRLLGDNRLAHGIDPSKRNIENFFRKPCQPREKSATFFRDYKGKGRMPLDVAAWLAQIELARPEPKPEAPAPAPASAPAEAAPVGRMGSFGERSFDQGRANAARAAFQAERMTKGKGNQALFTLGKELALSGLTPSDVQAELLSEAAHMRSPSDRLRQVPGIMKWLEENGLFGLSKAA